MIKTIPILIVIIAIAGFAFLFKSKLIQPQIYQPTQSPQQIAKSADLLDYTSQDLKISFKYPKNWYMEDEYPFVLISSFKSSLHKDFQLEGDQTEFLVSNFNGCHSTIEENLIDPACGEGGTKVERNKILSKETRRTNSGTFYKYVIQTPNNEFTFYLLENKDKIIQIEKHPDPSQFEKEFEEIVNSIEFL